MVKTICASYGVLKNVVTNGTVYYAQFLCYLFIFVVDQVLLIDLEVGVLGGLLGDRGKGLYQVLGRRIRLGGEGGADEIVWHAANKSLHVVVFLNLSSLFF